MSMTTTDDTPMGVFAHVLTDYENLRGYIAHKYDDPDPDVTAWLKERKALFVEGVPGTQELQDRFLDALHERFDPLRHALYKAVLYLDGFVWVSEPEFSELEAIKRTVIAAFRAESWEQVMERARALDAVCNCTPEPGQAHLDDCPAKDSYRDAQGRRR